MNTQKRFSINLTIQLKLFLENGTDYTTNRWTTNSFHVYILQNAYIGLHSTRILLLLRHFSFYFECDEDETTTSFTILLTLCVRAQHRVSDCVYLLTTQVYLFFVYFAYITRPFSIKFPYVDENIFVCFHYHGFVSFSEISIINDVLSIIYYVYVYMMLNEIDVIRIQTFTPLSWHSLWLW